MKVNQAKVCLTCDEIYNHEEQFCPSCTEKESIYLPTRPVPDAPAYFAPLTPLKIIKEVKKDGTFSHYTLQMVSEVKPADNDDVLVFTDAGSKLLNKLLNEAQVGNQSRFDRDYKSEPPAAGLGEGDNPSRKSMGREGCFTRWGNRLDAGYALIGDALCRVFREGTLLPGKEYYCGNENTCILSTNIPELEGGIK